ncbi:MAG: hypothetical protein R3B70_04280 [Polyangiaceae bacterium]
MIKKSLAYAGILASVLTLQMSGCTAPDAELDDSTASESGAIVIDSQDIRALRSGEHITVDLTDVGASYQIEFSSLADLDAIRVIASDGEHVLGQSIELDGGLEAGTLMLTPAGAKLYAAKAGEEEQLSGFCIEVCCWRLICFIEK